MSARLGRLSSPLLWRTGGAPPPNYNTLALWHDYTARSSYITAAIGSPVSTVLARVGSNATATGTAQPTRRADGLEFQADDYLALDAGVTVGSASVWVCYIVKFTSSTLANYIVAHSSVTRGYNFGGAYQASGLSPGIRSTLYNGLVRGTGGTGDIALNTWYAVAAGYSTSYINGVEFTYNILGAVSSFTVDRIGQSATNPSIRTNGTIAQLLIYSTPPDIPALTLWLQSRTPTP